MRQQKHQGRQTNSRTVGSTLLRPGLRRSRLSKGAKGYSRFRQVKPPSRRFRTEMTIRRSTPERQARSGHKQQDGYPTIQDTAPAALLGQLQNTLSGITYEASRRGKQNDPMSASTNQDRSDRSDNAGDCAMHIGKKCFPTRSEDDRRGQLAQRDRPASPRYTSPRLGRAERSHHRANGQDRASRHAVFFQGSCALLSPLHFTISCFCINIGHCIVIQTVI